MVRLRYNQQEKVWDEIPEGETKTDRDIVFSRLWKNTLDRAKKDISNDLDVTILFTGEVGAGKSTFAKISCRYMSDEEFNPRQHMVKDFEDFPVAMRAATKGRGAVLVDEASKIAAATNTMTKGTKNFNELMDVCRQRCLFIALCAPNFARLSSHLAIDRTKVLARVYIDTRTGLRGRYSFYGSRLKERLYLSAKKNHGSMKYPKPKYRGTFGNDLLNQEVYVKMKDETFEATLQKFEENKKDKAPTPAETIHKYRINLVKIHIDKSVSDMAEMLDVSPRTIDNYRKEAKELIASENQESQGEKTLNPTQAAAQT